MQLLAAARLAMVAADDHSKPFVHAPLQSVEELLRDVEDQLMTCSARLQPRVLDDLGPRAALQSLCRRFSQSSGLKVKAELGNFRAPGEIGAALYNAVLEALNNVEQHARADRVRIWLYEKNAVIHCCV